MTRESTWEEPVALKVRREVRRYFGTSWSEHIHRETRRHFFFDRETKRSTWKMPEELKTRPKTSLWTEHFDKDYGEKYFYNERLDILCWEFPPNLAKQSTKKIGSWAELQDAASLNSFYYNIKTHVVTWSHPSSPKRTRKKSISSSFATWIIFKDKANRIYYRNKITNENRWLPPHWTAIQDRVTLRYFYLNELTGQTQWYRPGLESYYRNRRRKQRKNKIVVDDESKHVVEEKKSTETRRTTTILKSQLRPKFELSSREEVSSSKTKSPIKSDTKMTATTTTTTTTSNEKNKDKHLLDFQEPTPFTQIPMNDSQNKKSKDGSEKMKRCLERGGLVLLNFCRTRKGKERFKYKLCERQTKTTMEKEFATFKKTVKGLVGDAFIKKKDEFMAKMHVHYLERLDRMEHVADGKSCIGVFRLQDEPDDPFLPPRFGDLILVWCPNRGTMHMTMQDRMTVVPQTVEAVEAFLDRNRITLPRKLRRSAGGPSKTIMTRQKIGDPLEYSYVYHKLFQRAETHELTAERKKEIEDERFHWKPPKTAKPVRKSKRELKEEDEKRGEFPRNGRLIHNFDPQITPTEEDIATDKYQMRKLRDLLDKGTLLCFSFHPHKKRNAKDFWTYDTKDLPRFFCGMYIHFFFFSSSLLTQQHRTTTNTGLENETPTTQGTSLNTELNRWKRAMKKKWKIYEIDSHFSELKKDLMRARHREYLEALKVVQNTFSDEPRVCVIRLQREPEGFRQPGVFADIILVWNPLTQGPKMRKLTWSERACTAAPTIQTICDYLVNNGIVSAINKRREAYTIDQIDENPLFYDEIYRKLFGCRPRIK